MAQAANAAPLNLGFLTILQEAGGTMGGYLVTNSWGRPLEFRLSSAVQPNRVQQILYGGTLQPYVCGELIGRTLVEKTAAPIQLLLTDHQAALETRVKLSIPVVWLSSGGEGGLAARCVREATDRQGALYTHERFAADVAAARELLDRLDPAFDLSEPFVRIREAVAEARKLAVSKAA